MKLTGGKNWDSALCCLTVLLAAQPAGAAELKKKTLEAFERYAQLTDERLNTEMKGAGPFLWVEGLPQARRDAAYAQMRAGRVVIERLETRDAGKEIKVPNGIIHHWVGTAFLAGVTLEKATAVLLDYDNHYAIYKPDVARSKLLARNGNEYKMYLRFIKKKVITVVMDTEHDVHFLPQDAARAVVLAHSTRIAEVENAGKPNERQLPVGNDGGFMWRLYTYWRFLERDGGTYIQCEAITLTRDIPWGLRWLIGPFVTSIPRESLEFTMSKTYAALLAGQAAATSP